MPERPTVNAIASKADVAAGEGPAGGQSPPTTTPTAIAVRTWT